VEEKMTPSQIEKTQDMARNWKTKEMKPPLNNYPTCISIEPSLTYRRYS
jgi:hypothetical protein